MPKTRAVSPESFTVQYSFSYFWLLARPEDSLSRLSLIVNSFFGAAGVGSAATAGSAAAASVKPVAATRASTERRSFTHPPPRPATRPADHLLPGGAARPAVG